MLVLNRIPLIALVPQLVCALTADHGCFVASSSRGPRREQQVASKAASTPNSNDNSTATTEGGRNQGEIGRCLRRPGGSSGRVLSVLKSTAMVARGGGIHDKTRTHSCNHSTTRARGVNRGSVPPEEALSRYPTLKTPGGLVRLLDYVGTASFAMSGAATAGTRGMNLLGCLVVGSIAATGGGTTRDLLLGQTPVFWLVEVEYLGICVATALITFILWPILSKASVLSLMGTGFDGWLSQAIDTIGLASFAVAGTQHGIRRGCHPLVTIIICIITCSGGGIIRDVLTSSPVLVLSAHAQMYVSTTAVGSAAYLVARRVFSDPLVRISAGFFCVVTLRILATTYNIRLPTMVDHV